MIRVPVPNAVATEVLAADLRAAGHPEAGVFIEGAELVVVGVDDAAAVDAAVASHVPPGPPADPNEALRQRIEAASNFAELRAALLGTGSDAAVAGRPTGA